jgi:putative salt-induced outer membrane protein YdiY
MERKLTLAAICLLPFATLHVSAEDAVEEKSPLTATAELGFLYKTGNSKSADVKAGFNVTYEKNQWTTLAVFNILAKKTEITDADDNKEFETTDNKWDIIAQTNYALGDGGKNYLYGSLGYEQDKFSGFESQSSFSAGWGRHWYETKTSSLFADFGPGVKYDVLRATDTSPSENKTDFIIQAQALYKLQINEFVEFKQYLIAKQAVESGENSVYKSETSITTKLIDSLQLKFAIRVDYDTEVEEGFENTNTETSMTLVYNF